MKNKVQQTANIHFKCHEEKEHNEPAWYWDFYDRLRRRRRAALKRVHILKHENTINDHDAMTIVSKFLVFVVWMINEDVIKYAETAKSHEFFSMPVACT